MNIIVANAISIIAGFSIGAAAVCYRSLVHPLERWEWKRCVQNQEGTDSICGDVVTQLSHYAVGRNQFWHIIPNKTIHFLVNIIVYNSSTTFYYVRPNCSGFDFSERAMHVR